MEKEPRCEKKLGRVPHVGQRKGRELKEEEGKPGSPNLQTPEGRLLRKN